MKRLIASAVLLIALLTPTASGAATASECLGDISPNVEISSERDASVYRLYCAYFLRQPDSGGFAYWHEVTADAYDISGFFADSEEFQIRYGALDNRAFMSLIYKNVLDRPEDPGGFGYWLDLLNSGQLNRGQLMVNFSDSPEYRKLIDTPIVEPRTGGVGTITNPYALGTRAQVQEYKFLNNRWTMSVTNVIRVPKHPTYGLDDGKECWLIQLSGTLDQLDPAYVDDGIITDNLPTPKLLINKSEAEHTINDCGTVAELEALGYGDWNLNARAAVGGSVSTWATYLANPGDLSWVSIGATAWR